MRSDYQLKHQLFGRQGSLWERQTTPDTQRQIRGLVKTGGNAEVLTQLDITAASAIGSKHVLKDGHFFHFAEGDFAVVGRHQRDYNHHSVRLVDGQRLHIAYRPSAAEISPYALPTRIAKITADFVNSINSASVELEMDDRDWYLIPTPKHIVPIAIQGRDPDVCLVSGIDFVARHGYIAMTDNPGDVLPYGIVKVLAASEITQPKNSYTLSSPGGGGKFLSSYTRKTQSASAFRAAAAEYAGLYVFQTPDVIIDARQVGTQAWVYTAVEAGPIEIGYPHVPLQVFQTVQPGFVICDRFDVLSAASAADLELISHQLEGWSSTLNLDGLLPVNGLSWDPNLPLSIDSVESDPTHGNKPHIRVHFSGDDAVLARYWRVQKLHERQTGVFLFDLLGEPSTPGVIDFWDFVAQFYKSQLIVVLAEDHTPRIDTRLRRFVLSYRPASCAMLTGLKTRLPAGGAATDDYGNFIIDDDGDYVPPIPPDACDTAVFTYAGYVMSLGGSELAHTSCEEIAAPDAHVFTHQWNNFYYGADVFVYNS